MRFSGRVLAVECVDGIGLAEKSLCDCWKACGSALAIAASVWG